MWTKSIVGIIALAILLLPVKFAQSKQHPWQTFSEQRNLDVRQPGQLPATPLPDVGVPFTVSNPSDNRQPELISLDEAIQLALRNADVIRVLAGVTAVSSGNTIYDVAIANTGIDLQTAVFDPTIDADSIMNKTDRPGASFDPLNPNRAIFVGSSTDSISSTVGISKRNINGATLGVNASAVGSYFEPGVFPLEPEYRSFAEITLRQPFKKGFGRAANLAPVVIARIDTERSYFQFKNSVQELVRSVINAYWNLVAARIDVWARAQQLEQSEFAYDRATARQKQGLAQAADVAQARSALANFKATLITARSNLILAEAAIRNILNLDPSDTYVFVPTSLPVVEQIDFDWNEMLRLGEQYRPDIIELKLILEADRQALLQANNQANPQFDGIANYRWDGLSGEMPDGSILRNDPGRFAGFNLGVNFSVPLGLRADRAALRRQELILARDKTNLDQGIHQMVHQLTINYRNLDQFFEQYVAFKEAREAARLNYENQAGEVLAGRREFINVLQAIVDWGNAVSAEASSITQYNTELANVELQTGTILETHGVRFVEERFGSLGPRLFGVKRCSSSYFESLLPEGSQDRYPESSTTSDDAFNLEDLDYRREPRRPKQTPQLNPEKSVPEVQRPQPPGEQDTNLDGKNSMNTPPKPRAQLSQKRKRWIKRLR